jgi:cyclic nucleotide gated channel, plant
MEISVQELPMKGLGFDLFYIIFRFFVMILMILGVCAYSFAIGSITNVLANMDTKEAQLKERISVLEDIRERFAIGSELYMKIFRQLKYDHKKSADNQIMLLESLPPQLRYDLSFILHEEIIEKLPYFKDKTKTFITQIGPKLKPVRVQKGQYVYKTGDPIDEIYFIIKGTVGYVLNKEKAKKDDIYVKVRQGINFYI